MSLLKYLGICGKFYLDTENSSDLVLFFIIIFSNYSEQKYIFFF